MKTQFANEFFRFRSPTKVIAGDKLCHDIVDYLKEYNFKKLLCLQDKAATDNQYAQNYITVLNKNYEMLFIEGPKGEPDFHYLEEIRKKAVEFRPDAVIGFGGGSTIDSAKGLAIVVNNSRHSSEYQGLDLMEKPGIPCIAIPTLFGAGTEVTASAVFINREKNKKGGINGEWVFPKLALLDSSLSLAAPSAIIGATGLDALVHAIEGFAAKCATPLSKIFSMEATKVLVPTLKRLAKNNQDVGALNNLAFGSFLAVNGLMHSESGICGAISYPLGVFHQVPHGLAGGIVMPKAIELNKSKGALIYRDLEKEVGGDLSLILRDLIEKFSLKSFENFGLTEENAQHISSEVYTYKGILVMNPVELADEDIYEIVCSAL